MASGSSRRRARRSRATDPFRGGAAAPGRSATTMCARVGMRSKSTQASSRAIASIPRIRHREASGSSWRSSCNVSAVTVGPACESSRPSASSPGTSSSAASSRRMRTSGLATGGSRNRGLGAGIRRTESRRRAARNSRASLMCAQCTGSNVPPRTPITRTPPDLPVGVGAPVTASAGRAAPHGGPRREGCVWR